MLQGLRELFASLSEKGRFWLAVAILASLLVVFILTTLSGGDAAGILKALLGG
ncbi:MAG: hypothetical protein U0X20_22075 [Caldilineaceae bacterium]